MRLDPDQCWERLAGARHGVLATVHPSRGVDAVPVVFAVIDSPEHRLVIPIDTVKPKQPGRLQRLANVEGDARAVLLVDRYEEDWSALWWVRVHARAVSSAPTDEAMDHLADRYPQYRVPGSVVAIVTLQPTELSGWSAGEG